MKTPMNEVIANFEIKSEVYTVESRCGNLFLIQINYLPDEICGWLYLHDGGVANYIVGLSPDEEKTKAVEMILNEGVAMIDYKEKTGEF